MKSQVRGGILAVIGYILSPLSWWNDLIINLPLAYAIAFPFGLISKKFFVPVMILAYWGTNVAGLMLMHHGVKDFVIGEAGNAKKALPKDLLISLVYTLGIALFFYFGWLKFPLDYFG